MMWPLAWSWPRMRDISVPVTRFRVIALPLGWTKVTWLPAPMLKLFQSMVLRCWPAGVVMVMFGPLVLIALPLASPTSGRSDALMNSPRPRMPVKATATLRARRFSPVPDVCDRLSE
ncbi:hypothetical protein D3C78_1598180 [compost metagenome]